MKFKRSLAVLALLISLLSLIAITACSGQPTSQTASEAAATSSLRGKEISVFAGSASKPALDEAARVTMSRKPKFENMPPLPKSAGNISFLIHIKLLSNNSDR